jgi:diguanylate cyclase (GGDEF)-like protein/PAS domain S-box-containing protein
MSRPLLLIMRNASDARAAGQWLAGSGDGPFEVEWVGRCRDALQRLGDRQRESVAAVVIDLDLPDDQGIAAFDKVQAVALDVPVLVLSRSCDEDVARQAVRRGAQDYLLMEHLDGSSLLKALSGMLGRAAHAQALIVEGERARITLNSIGDAVVSTDLSGNVTYLNPVAEGMTGWSSKEACGRPLREVLRIVDADSREPPPDPVALAILHERSASLSANCVLIRRDGREFGIEDSAAPIRDQHGCLTGAVIVFHDVSAARANSVKMSYLAQHDPLTELPNRLLLRDRLTQAMAAARRHGKSLAILFLDVDHFKHINDSLGHAVGDRLLQSIATRLIGCVRRSDTVSRLGGDEFVILLSEVTQPGDVVIAANKILAAMSTPHRVGQHDLRVTVSLGSGIYPEDAEDADALLTSADIALFQAKARGRGNHQFFVRGSKGRTTQAAAPSERRVRSRGLRNVATKPARAPKAPAGDRFPS